LFGYAEQDLLHQKVTLLMPDYLRFLNDFTVGHFLETGIRKHGRDSLEITGLHKNGQEIPLEISFNEFIKEGSRFFTVIIRDISERKVLLNKLEYMAYRDTLTNLPNRAMLRERIEFFLKNPKDDYGLALMFIDLDNFKVVNDSLGHEFGDEVLKVVARRLSAMVRSDDFVARLGGDEFVILLSNISTNTDIPPIAQKILNTLDYPIDIQKHEVRLGGSMGIALYPKDGNNTNDLLRSADLAMYQAKKEKGTFRFFTDDLNERAQERLSLENDLRMALLNHEISVHYQPRIDLLSGRITGAEALARWFHPQKGFISPGRFIPIAEETGLIHSLGLNVLRQACIQLRQWQKKGYPFFRVSVNLAPQQLHHTNLVANIQSILEQTGLEPSYLELEVTESGAMKNIKESMPTLQAFRDMGIHIAVDDFGTGYSSLSYLQRLPIDSLKIDRSFLINIGSSRDASDEVIAKVIMSLGKNLGLNVVAEGIETTQQLKFLLQFQCDEAQGFLFSKPLPAVEFEHYLMNNNTKNLLTQFKQGHPTLF
jgi:diguanylate cyclase (GGDEF)-like protein/PAS domain S-box-containing protein